MNTGTIFGVLIAMLLLLGGLLFIAAQFVLHKIKSEHSKSLDRKKKLWIWRSFILVLIAYSVFLLLANKDALSAYFPGPLHAFLLIFISIYFIALVEMVVIDLLLPDVVHMWQRILVEIIVFVVLCGLSFFIFNFSLVLAAGSA